MALTHGTLLIFHLIACLSLKVNADYISWSNPECLDGHPITATKFNLNCGDNDCDFASEANVEVDLKFDNASAPEDTRLTGILVMEFQAPLKLWTGTVSSDVMDLCGTVTPSSNDTRCPEDGAYDYADVVTLPDRPSRLGSSWILTGWGVTVRLNIVDVSGLALLDCSTIARLIPGTSEDDGGRFQTPTAFASSIALAALLISMAFGCLFLRCRRRRHGKEDEDVDGVSDQDTKSTNNDK